MNIVTITCPKHYEILKLQLESIVKFVEKCTHWIVIHNKFLVEEELNACKKTINQYYSGTLHKVNILTLEDFSSYKSYELILNLNNGWERQQALKLLISDKIKDNYLILDSECFFIRKTNIKDWEKTIGCNVVVDFKNISGLSDIAAKELSNKYALYFNKKPLKVTLRSDVPFFIHKKIISSVEDIDTLVSFFCKQNSFSEFLFYCYLIPENILYKKIKPKYFHFWDEHQDKHITKNITSILNNDTLVVSFQDEFITHITKNSNLKSFLIMNYFLKTIGLTYQFKI